MDANGGIDTLQGTFQLLGIILVVAGVALIALSLRLGQQQTTETET